MRSRIIAGILLRPVNTENKLVEFTREKLNYATHSGGALRFPFTAIGEI